MVVEGWRMAIEMSLAVRLFSRRSSGKRRAFYHKIHRVHGESLGGSPVFLCVPCGSRLLAFQYFVYRLDVDQSVASINRG